LRDFSLAKYRELIESLKNRKYNFLTFLDFIAYLTDKSVILRHDVDLKPGNALEMARLEKVFGIKGSYYFRSVPESYEKNIIKQISEMGHEVGYHYETVDTVTSDKLKVTSNREEIVDRAFELFCKELEKFRKIVEIKTICMHGSPRGKWDNRMIWEKYNYRDLGIIGEPYFDVDWNKVGYLTDTGRRWNGDKFSIRDKVDSKYKFDFKTTDDIMNNIDSLPDKMMFTIHPQRWSDSFFPWAKELVWQNAKNTIKLFINKKRSDF
jgi:hypothetical protein